ncbi:biotin-dependent carboxyltransferase family protein [Saccharopolyspora sp. ASAGF58]|uniref:5-oxoprolinase subunit C family protein n=1 Tax=Saccharopolyspora sp. ASAGF58 TaxID=2719023 RepID=UPI00143FB993|nr:biotin-dependent carboxyltransferase family protein [Saccharopolyspora sp. ASAGF58]QIZ37638.1 urea amidolyase [Saccharopolyspora sp. ASAGF58]
MNHEIIRRSPDEHALEVLDAGIQTTVQDWPGRRGMRPRGFFPSGPMDHFAARVANVLVGNAGGAAVLEIPVGRFSARVGAPGLVALCGAEGAAPSLNGIEVPLWESFEVRPGDLVSCSRAKGPGFRLNLAFSGGFAVPEVFGSRSTHLVAGVGGIDGRALIRGDVLTTGTPKARAIRRARLPQSLRPTYPEHWEIEVMRGPHTDPEFVTEQDWADFVSAAWRVNMNSDRSATRLNTHHFQWSRTDGGAAGGHPSNVPDFSYPLGGIHINGDTPMILGPDGASSGGFVVIATVVHAALWKIGQLRPGRDTVRFREVGIQEAYALAAHTEYALDPRHLETL